MDPETHDRSRSGARPHGVAASRRRGGGPALLREKSRRGAAILAFVVALLVIGTIVLWMLQLTSAGSRSYLSHYNGTGAFYAAEGGIEIAFREVNQNNDFDSDGTIGTISNNGNDADDPSLGTGAFHVGKVTTTYTATGSWRGFKRVLEVQTQ